MNTTEREAFEAWCEKERINTRRQPGQSRYVSSYTNGAWDAWRGRAKAILSVIQRGQINEEALEAALSKHTCTQHPICKVGAAHLVQAYEKAKLTELPDEIAMQNAIAAGSTLED